MSADTPTTTPESLDGCHPQQSSLKSFSCVLCAQRKVKCDKLPGGCSNCTKARIDCVYRTPPPPRRQKRGLRDVDNRARLRIYEDALRKLGVDPEALVKQELDQTQRRVSMSSSKAVNDFYEAVLPESVRSEQQDGSGVLVSRDGKSRYLENSLWTSLKSDFRDSEDVLEDNSSDNDGSDTASSPPFAVDNGASMLLDASKSGGIDLYFLHPQPVQIFKLWQTYLDNINPLIRILHTPTVQQIISRASGNLEDVPKSIEALLFSIYAISLQSLSGTECVAIMGESKAAVEKRFRAGAQMALVNANFMKTSDSLVLKALVLFIAAVHSEDPRVIWILTGVASRIGQRLGLHRDPDKLGLPPFESEMRRRLWWQIVMQDGYAEKLAGTGNSSLSCYIKRPSNLNDSALFPGMKELPKEQEGATDMMFFLIRIRLGEFLSKSSLNTHSNFDGVWNKLATHTAPLTVKLQAIDELESLYEREFLRYCDDSISWHFLCSILCKSIIDMLRFIAHSPEGSGRPRDELPAEERDMLFRTTTSIIERHASSHTNPVLHGYLWHITSHFQWKAFIYMLSELCHRTTGPDVDHAWTQVAIVWETYPQFAREATNTAFAVAISNLMLKAWDAHVRALVVPLEREPRFIQTLRAKRARRENPSSSSSSSVPRLQMNPHRPQLSPLPPQQPSLLQPSPATFLNVQPTHPPSLPSFFAPSTESWDPSNFSSSAACFPDQPPVPNASSLSSTLDIDPSSFASGLERNDNEASGAFLAQALSGADAPMLMEPEQMDWASWDKLLAGFDGEAVGVHVGVGVGNVDGAEGGGVGF